MGGNDSKIDTSITSFDSIKSNSPLQVTTFSEPFRKYKSQYMNETGKTISFNVSIIEPTKQKILVSQKCYTDMEQVFNKKTKNIYLNSVIFDPYYLDRPIFIANDNKKQLALQVRPFIKFNTQLFNNILYELHINQIITKFKCQYLNTFTDFYSIENTLKGQEEHFPYSQVLVMQPISTTLSEIIKYRRQNKWNWSTSQFSQLCRDLSKAVIILHQNKLVHNDIRPHNVYYSLQNNCYQLGGFSKINKINKSMKQVCMISSKFFTPENCTQNNNNSTFYDLFALGMTLFCAFYLYQPLDYNSILKQNKKYYDIYPYIKQLQQLLVYNEEEPVNLEKIYKQLPKSKTSSKMKNFIKSLQYKNAPKDLRFIQTKKTISDAYQRLGLWNQWKNNLIDVFQLQQANLQQYTKAMSLLQLARIQSWRGDFDNANEYAKRSSTIFRNLAYAAYDQGNADQAISLFQKAIGACKYFLNQNDIDLGKNLQGLALAHSEKGQYEVSKPLIDESLKIVKKNLGEDSLDYCKIKISKAHIQSDFGQFQEAKGDLNKCLNISEVYCKKKDQMGFKLKAQILHDIGKIYMLQSTQSNNSEKLLKKAYKSFNKSLTINEEIPNNQMPIIANIEALGQVQMRQNSYLEARNTFRKAQMMRQNPQQKESSLFDKQRADNLCQIAACQTQLGQYKQALRQYKSAITIYKQIYGSDHNKLSAITIGNMSKVYKKLKQKQKAKQCLYVALSIIQDICGTDDPDYQHFKILQRQL